MNTPTPHRLRPAGAIVKTAAAQDPAKTARTRVDAYGDQLAVVRTMTDNLDELKGQVRSDVQTYGSRSGSSITLVGDKHIASLTDRTRVAVDEEALAKHLTGHAANAKHSILKHKTVTEVDEEALQRALQAGDITAAELKPFSVETTSTALTVKEKPK